MSSLHQTTKMCREILPSPSPLGYFPVETTDQATVGFPTANAATTITVEAPHLEPPTSFPTQPPLPQPPQSRPIAEQEPDFLSVIVGLLLLVGASVIIYKALGCLTYRMTYGFDPYGPEVRVESVSFSVQNISSCHITTEGEIKFNITRAADCAVSIYDNIVMSIFYKEKPLSMTVMEPFTQKGMNHTMVKAMFPSIVSPIDSRISKRIALYFIRNSSFEFSFDVKAKGRLWPNEWTGPENSANARTLNIWCPNVKVEIVAKTGLGTMAGGEPLKCKVQAQNRI
ncbi:hypothetical protein RHSIM_Rhsim07G0169200 [Rhododendron simsii]|uniref:Late embryogenesis abundant protein LEA-2 subgroup domain-containing protein n=1 Tax=Rhododendron simsii TaxID=118357 RepID=A0A834LFZ7_RHOSS|nr:hypothetical protein RHSIM_Rhsim07G0169200 [Rhododendron simsii]